MTRAYYNENDPKAAAWLRELIKRDLIAPGEVDERSIKEVKNQDLAGFAQCHFFAGVGVWSYALRRAGWVDDKPVWTGSCPCQPFSIAGKRKGKNDERHLWPSWFPLIQEWRPCVVFGEQVASKDGLAWLDDVSSNLEGEGYSIGAVDLCSAGFGAPHIRQRLFFGAALDRTDSNGEQNISASEGGLYSQPSSGRNSRDGCDSSQRGVGAYDGESKSGDESQVEVRGSGTSSNCNASDVREWRGPGWLDPVTARSVAEGGATRGFWGNADWWLGRDGKYRPIGPGLSPLAYGAPARVGRLRGYGNAINAEVASGFIEAFVECMKEARRASDSGERRQAN